MSSGFDSPNPPAFANSRNAQVVAFLFGPESLVFVSEGKIGHSALLHRGWHCMLATQFCSLLY